MTYLFDKMPVQTKPEEDDSFTLEEEPETFPKDDPYYIEMIKKFKLNELN